MHSAEDSAAIAVRILQRREQERVVEAAEREENDRLQAALAESRNEVATLRDYAAGLEARLNGLYAEQDMAALLRPRGIGRRLVRAIVVAFLGAGGVLLFQLTTPLGAAQISQAIRRPFRSHTSSAPASPQPTPPPAPVRVQQPEPHAGSVPSSAPAANPVAPIAQTAAPAPAPAVAPPRSESGRRAPHAATKHAQPRKEVQGREVQEAVIPACSENDPLCGISKRPH
jgi:hypothetical protein